MKKLCSTVNVMAALIGLITVTGYSQYSSYTTPPTASPYSSQGAAPPVRRAPWARRAPNTARQANVQNPYVNAAPQSADPAATQYHGEDQGETPAATAPIREEEFIPPTEQPRGNAAMTAAAESAAPGSVTYLNRRINFPRDRGDDVDILKLQVFLDYHGYSPGEIDGRWGYNTERALYVYQRNNALTETGQLDERMMARINAFKEGYLLEYTITDSDAKGPYFYIPRDYYDQAKMKRLPYETAIEMLGEKFHCSQSLLRKLNPGIDFDGLRAGQKILGLNVTDGIDDKRGKVNVIRVSKHNKWIETYDAQGRFMFYYPSTLGSQYDPLPLGNFEVINVVQNPPFRYQPKLFWDDDPNKPEAMIPPGPNSPVGVVWIGTSRKSVGLHGTPNPENISKNTSHGCIRMTNWDAVQLSKRVSSGTKIEFVN